MLINEILSGRKSINIQHRLAGIKAYSISKKSDLWLFVSDRHKLQIKSVHKRVPIQIRKLIMQLLMCYSSFKITQSSAVMKRGYIRVKCLLLYRYSFKSSTWFPMNFFQIFILDFVFTFKCFRIRCSWLLVNMFGYGMNYVGCSCQYSWA